MPNRGHYLLLSSHKILRGVKPVEKLEAFVRERCAIPLRAPPKSSPCKVPKSPPQSSISLDPPYPRQHPARSKIYKVVPKSQTAESSFASFATLRLRPPLASYRLHCVLAAASSAKIEVAKVRSHKLPKIAHSNSTASIYGSTVRRSFARALA
jgi:hypothetical protein